MKKNKKISSYIILNIILIILSLILSLLIIVSFSKKSEEILLPLAESKIKKVISLVINHATDDLEYKNNIYTLDKENNEIKMINYNTKEVVKLLDTITFKIENDINTISSNKNLPYIENSMYGIIPFGIIFESSMLSNIGPKIKIKFEYLGNIVSKIETEIKPYGINNAYVEMRVSLSVTGRIILPFVSKEITIDNVIPISINIIPGKVPDAYISSYK